MYFFDTYALYQLAKGEENYSIFKNNAEIATSLLNLYELYYSLCRDKEEKLAEDFFNRLLPCCLDITSDDIKQAAKIRLKYIKKKLSYIDALGYALSWRQNILFLTGDKEFENLENVYFLK